MTRVYACRTGTSEYVVRHGTKDTDFRRDQFIANTFGNRLPVAPVRSIGKLPDNSFACLSDRLPGEPATERLLVTSGPINQSFADVLARIHTTDVRSTRGYGPARENGKGVLPRALYGAALRLTPAIMSGVTWRHTAIDRTSFKDIAGVYHSLGLSAARIPERRLLHGDLKADNMLTDGTTITGVIDWARFAYGDPALDLGILHVRYPGILNVEKYVESIDLNPDSIRDRILYYAIGECCVAITFFNQSGLQLQRAQVEQRLLQIVDQAESK